MTGPQAGPGTPVGAGEPLNSAERAVDELLDAAHLLAAHQLPGLLAAHGRRLGVEGATLYLADLQQDVLVPFVGPAGPALGQSVGPMAVEATLAGRAYQQVQVRTHELPGGHRQLGGQRREPAQPDKQLRVRHRLPAGDDAEHPEAFAAV